MRTKRVNESMVGLRLDVAVTALIPSLSRSSIQKLSKYGKLKVNNEPARPGHKLRLGDKLIIDYDEKENAKIPVIDIPVIYEDDDVLVINKPLGLLTHSKGLFNPEATVATWLSNRVKTMEGERAGIVHRLDRATSGVMIVAKNPEALSWLQKQFSTRKVKKTYIAVVNGEIDPREAIIDMPIQRNPQAPATFKVGANGKPSVTHYKTLESVRGYSLIELKPETGRTHQLRVHLAKLKHPIVGDILYNGEPAERLYLHALNLELTLPSRERKIFNSPLPSSFKEIVK